MAAPPRSRDGLVVTGNGRASRLLTDDADCTAFSATELLSGDGPPSGSAAA
ncbi:hypothetical protein ABZ737_11310 [Streptomyces sp. NPDC013087]|uniref:hypothetical protein n=1 Tax=Streptomyces sp. NPDC013087 TaxID=3156694 RepID=UPI0033D8474D